MKNSDVVMLTKQLAKQGWRILCNKGHYKCYPPNKEKEIVIISSTPREWFITKRKVINDLRKSGANIKQL